jgi:hypothetical protein
MRIHRTLRTGTAAALLVLGACSDKKPKTIVEPPPVVPHTLSVVAGPGVAIMPAPGSYPGGSVLPYTVTSLPGYGAPDVVVDSVVGAASGSVTMNADHVLLASAPLAPTAVAPTDPVLAAARQVVTAADPVAAYGAYLGAVADLAARVSDDSTRRHVAAASRLAFDWAADSAAILRADAALAGKVFALGEAPLPGARPAAQAAGDAQVKTAYVFTNGIFTGPGGAAEGMLAMAAAARQAGRRLTTLGDGSAPGGASPRVVYLVNYNRSTLPALGAGVCVWKAVLGMVDRGLPYAVRLWRMSAGQREVELGCTLHGDLFESISQLSRQLYEVPTSVPGDALRLAVLAKGWRAAGYNVVLSAHSQGNLMTTDALASVAPLRAGGPTCMSFVSIASPAFVPTPQAVPVDGVVIAHERARDFVLGIPGPKAASLSTGLARSLNDDMGWWTRILPTQALVTDLAVGLRLHLLAGSYLASAESREWITARLGSHYARLADDCGGWLAARVVNGETRAPLAGAEVRVAGAGTALAATPASGQFVTARMQARPVDLVVSAPGYESVTLYGVEPLRLDTLTLPEIPLVKTDSVPGGISGVVRNARNLAAIPNALLTLRRGINATSGEVVASTRSVAGGAYQITGVRAGTYTLTVEAAGFVSETRTGIVIGSRILAGQDVLVSPDDLDLRIKLTWGAAPADLDSHLTGPRAAGGRFHVYFADKGALDVDPFAALDVDDVTSFGPETITVTRQVAGVYRYSVHDYTNRNSTASSALGASGATVTVYLRGQIIATYAVPSAPGTLWTVFEIENGVLRRINTMGYGTAFDRLPAGAANAVQPLPEKPAH